MIKNNHKANKSQIAANLLKAALNSHSLNSAFGLIEDFDYNVEADLFANELNKNK